MCENETPLDELTPSEAEAPEETEAVAEEAPEETTEGGDRRKEKKKPTEYCSLCFHPIGEEDPAVLTMGHFGNPRYLCADCAMLLDLATTDTNPDRVEDACEDIAELLAASNTDDSAVIETVNGILDKAAARGKAIADGTYDFSLDEATEEDGLDEIPEELRETEEDRERDEREAARSHKSDTVFAWVFTGIVFAALVYFVLRMFVFR